MTRILTIIFLIFPLLSIGQKNIRIGKGVINIDLEKLPSINFYSDTLQTSSAKIVTVTKDNQGEFIIVDKQEIDKWFKPEALWLDYSIFVIRVDTSIGNWYRVYADNVTGATLWTKSESIKSFVSWNSFFLKQVTAVNKLDDFEVQIKSEPNDNSKTIKAMESTDCFQVLDIKGEWMKIKTNEILECNESAKTIKLGWIKWRRKNRLIVGYGLTC